MAGKPDEVFSSASPLAVIVEIQVANHLIQGNLKKDINYMCSCDFLTTLERKGNTYFVKNKK